MQIYKTTNIVNGRFYVGQDTKSDPKYLGSGSLLKQAIKKYGRENFVKEILEDGIEDRNVLNEREIFWIAAHREIAGEMMYNIQPGGFFPVNLKHWEETKLKISEALKGRTLSEEHRKNLGIASANRVWAEESRAKLSGSMKGNRNRTFYSESRRRSLSDARTGWIFSEETKRKISERLTGRKFSESHRENISKSSRGRNHTDETRKKMSLARSGVKRDEITKRNMSVSMRKKSVDFLIERKDLWELLEDKFQRVVELYVTDLSNEVIADMLKVKIQTLRSLVCKAKQILSSLEKPHC